MLRPNGQVGFAVGSYDHRKPLVIDPVLSYSTYLGGKTGEDGYGIAVGGDGSAYITGNTTSSNFPTKNPLQSSPGSQNEFDVFVAKLNSAGTALVYSTYLGGKSFDRGEGIAVDGAGNAYVTGTTGSTNFPIMRAYQPSNGGTVELADAFVAKLNATGSALLYSTYLGGSGYDASHAIAVDGSGNVYVTGETRSDSFPVANPFQSARTGSSDVFVSKINPTLAGAASLVYSTFLNGSNSGSDSRGFGIVVDGPGNAYVTGSTGSTNFPTTVGAYQTSKGGSLDSFVTKFNPAGSALVYSTYLGGSKWEAGYGIALDASANAYVTGKNLFGDFPTTSGAYQTVYSGKTEGFVTKINQAGSALVYSTYLGGSGDENQTGNPRAGGIAVDALGNAFVTGHTSSADFPVTANAFQKTYGGGNQYDAFVTKLNPTGALLVYSSFLGGSAMELGFGIALDGSGNAYVTGSTSSGRQATDANFPTKNPFQPRYGGGPVDAFVTKIV